MKNAGRLKEERLDPLTGELLEVEGPVVPYGLKQEKQKPPTDQQDERVKK